MSLDEKKQVIHPITENAGERVTGLRIATANEYSYTEKEYAQEGIKESEMNCWHIPKLLSHFKKSMN
jgi:hypothetical protein